MAVVEYSKKSRKKLSTNFSAYEFSCHGKGCCDTVLIDDTLVKYLQEIRDHFGKKITITSGYRCPTHNGSTKNASKTSRHTKGQAADIVVEGVAPAEVAKYAEEIGIKGIGLYETSNDGFFVHIDTRTSKAFWYGQAQKSRTTFRNTVSEATEYSLKKFVTDVQKACGAKQDGVAGPETLSKTPTVSAKYNRKHAVVMAVQKRLLALGYTEVGKADGVAGLKFASAVAHFQQDNGCVADGVISKKAKTWQKLLGML